MRMNSLSEVKVWSVEIYYLGGGDCLLNVEIK